jgi:hypothetical protein
VAAQLEPRVVPQLDGAQPQLVEALGGDARRRLVGDVGERRPGPEGERRVEVVCRVGDPLLGERVLGLPDEPLESRQVELARLEPDSVPVPVRLDAVGADRPPEPVHVDLERRARRARRLVPESVDEMVAGQHGAAVQQELGEERPLLRAAERHRPASRQGLDGPEDPELHCFARCQVALKRILSASPDRLQRQATNEKETR